MDSLKEFVFEGYKSASFTDCPRLPAWYDVYVDVLSFCTGLSVGALKKGQLPSGFQSVCNVLRLDGYWNGGGYCGHAACSLLQQLLLRNDCLFALRNRASRAMSL